MGGGLKAWSVFGRMDILGLSRVQSQLGSMDAAGSRVAGSAAGAAGSVSRFAASFAVVGLVAGAVAVESVRAFSEFDAAMTQSLAIMGDVSTAMRRDMEDAAMSVAATTSFSANNAAESFFFLASAGMDAEASIAALPVVANFAQAGMFDMARATDILTDAQSALGMSIRDDAIANMENMTHVADVLVKANTIANATVEQFGQALINRAAPRMRQFNVEVEEGVAVLAAYADQGIKGRVAGMQLNILLRDLTSTAVTNADAFKALGIEVFDAEGNLNNIADIVEDFENLFSGASDAQRTMAFEVLGLNQRVADALSTLLGMSGAIRENEESLRDAGGVMDEVAQKQLETFRARLGLVGSQLRNIFLIIGRQLLPVANALLKHALEPMLDWTLSFLGWAGGLTKWAHEFAVGVRALHHELKFVLDFYSRLQPLFERGISVIPIAGPLYEINKAIAATGEWDKVLSDVGGSFETLVQGMRRAGTIGSKELNEITKILKSDIPEGINESMLRFALLSSLPDEWASKFSGATIQVLQALNVLSDMYVRIGEDGQKGLVDPVEDATTGIMALAEEVERLFNQQSQSNERTKTLLETMIETSSEYLGLSSVQRDLNMENLSALSQAVKFASDLREQYEAGTLSVREQGDALRAILAINTQLEDEISRGVGEPGVVGIGAQMLENLTISELPAKVKAHNLIMASKVARALGKDMEGPLADLRGDFQREGSRLIASLAQGMLTAGDIVNAAIRIIATKFIMPGLLDIFGIFSPSRWMMDRGKDLMAGLAKGITDNADIVARSMAGAMGYVQDAATGGLHAGMGGMAGGGMGGGMRLQVNMPPARTPLDMVRDDQWQTALRESMRVAHEQGFRF